ncbi:hypothetical protein SAMN05421858_1681 [Haladaptatus litoreus]|uniref:Uncharacterized protein n=2 Tax=Haladaptatus litoreus TaxID=553468 RepID=A0A1N6YRB4_9EURY|nr:hypothetical protein SAMN05421858_1681 [Haladaptatus litoreus]
MIFLLSRSHTSTAAAALVGTLVGLAVVCLYFGAGLLIAGWSVSEFLTHITVDTIGYFLGMIVLVIAFVGLPIAIFLRFDLIAPLVLLVVVILGWLIVGAVQGILSFQTTFGLALYAAYLSPIALILYAIFGGSEYLFRTKKSSQ